MIRVGTAGWSYDDWDGIVYPPGRGRDFDRLASISRMFDTVEINTSFYHIPPARLARGWAGRIRNPTFRFTAKLHRSFTHEKVYPPASAITAFREFLEPLREGDRLGALLVQFPWSTRHDEETIRRMKRIFTDFRGVPLVVEVRHASFSDPAFHEFALDHGVTVAEIDQPAHHDALSSEGVPTAELAYMRFHGRNLAKWFDHEESWERYDYLYDGDELEPWVRRASTAPARDVFVIMNNHFRGQAVVNGLEVRRALGLPVEVPPTLAAAYPERFDPPAGTQASLFPGDHAV